MKESMKFCGRPQCVTTSTLKKLSEFIYCLTRSECCSTRFRI